MLAFIICYIYEVKNSAYALLFPGAISASGSTSPRDLVDRVAHLSIWTVMIGFGVLLLLIFLSTRLKKHGRFKPVVFGLIVTTVAVVTVILGGSTIYLNTTSSSRGPVHWHADFQIWACGQELDLVNPQGRLSNKVGTPTLHEHNDKRIHLEGVVVNPADASLGKFLTVVGGEISDRTLVVPTTSGVGTYLNGATCPDGPGQVQVFAYRVNPDKTFSQTKLDHPASYIISSESNVPPGDCLIIEFDRPKDRTDHLCRSFEVARQIDRLKGETRGN